MATTSGSTIVIGTDGSPAADSAVALGAHLAPPLGCDVVLAHVASVPAALTVGVMPLPDEFDAYAEDAGAYVLGQSGNLLADGDISYRTVLLRGAPATQLLKAIDQEDARMVIVGHRGVNAVEKLFMGSVADRLAHKSHRPVLIAPEPEADTEGPPEVSIRKIMVATDGSVSADTAVAETGALAKALDAEVLLVHVVDAPHGVTAFPVQEDMERVSHEAADAVLTGASGILEAEGVTPTRVVLTGKPAERLVAAVADEDVDLLVLGHRGVNLVERVFLGSVADRVAHDAPCPVLIVPPPED